MNLALHLSIYIYFQSSGSVAEMKLFLRKGNREKSLGYAKLHRAGLIRGYESEVEQ